MRTVSNKDLTKKVLANKADPSAVKPKTVEQEKPSETKVLAASMIGVAKSINENTRVVMGLVEYMKLQKEGKPVVVNVPEVKSVNGWDFKIERNAKTHNLMTDVKARKVE